VPFDSPLVVRRASDQLWEVVEPLVYRGRRDTFVVPDGFLTDFASVPRVVIWLIPRFGRYTPAAVLHDWLVTTGLTTGVVSSRDADGLFRRVLRELGVPPVRRRHRRRARRRPPRGPRHAALRQGRQLSALPAFQSSQETAQS
jgi:hypothetical protein